MLSLLATQDMLPVVKKFPYNQASLNPGGAANTSCLIYCLLVVNACMTSANIGNVIDMLCDSCKFKQLLEEGEHLRVRYDKTRLLSSDPDDYLDFDDFKQTCQSGSLRNDGAFDIIRSAITFLQCAGPGVKDSATLQDVLEFIMGWRETNTPRTEQYCYLVLAGAKLFLISELAFGSVVSFDSHPHDSDHSEQASSLVASDMQHMFDYLLDRSSQAYSAKQEADVWAFSKKGEGPLILPDMITLYVKEHFVAKNPNPALTAWTPDMLAQFRSQSPQISVNPFGEGPAPVVPTPALARAPKSPDISAAALHNAVSGLVSANLAAPALSGNAAELPQIQIPALPQVPSNAAEVPQIQKPAVARRRVQVKSPQAEHDEDYAVLVAQEEDMQAQLRALRAQMTQKRQREESGCNGSGNGSVPNSRPL